MSSPLAIGARRSDIVALDPDHPGFRDTVYRERRNAIAQLAFDYRPPEPVPLVEYTSNEHAVWRTVWASLSPLHRIHATREYLECSEAVALPHDEIPQLREVNGRLRKLTPFQMLPVAGLVSSRAFLGHLSRDSFLSTQYMRHHSVPLYTPEPDVVHELVGHAATFSHPDFVRLNRAFGAAAERATEEALEKIGRVYWYTMEYGVVRERGDLRAYGAGLLSSFGELERFGKTASIVPFDLAAMALRNYDPTTYQPVLFVAERFKDVLRDVTEWLERIAPPVTLSPTPSGARPSSFTRQLTRGAFPSEALPPCRPAAPNREATPAPSAAPPTGSPEPLRERASFRSPRPRTPSCGAGYVSTAESSSSP